VTLRYVRVSSDYLARQQLRVEQSDVPQDAHRERQGREMWEFVWNLFEVDEFWA
jgi:hypothetical protein